MQEPSPSCDGFLRQGFLFGAYIRRLITKTSKKQENKLRETISEHEQKAG